MVCRQFCKKGSWVEKPVGQDGWSVQELDGIRFHEHNIPAQSMSERREWSGVAFWSSTDRAESRSKVILLSCDTWQREVSEVVKCKQPQLARVERCCT